MSVVDTLRDRVDEFRAALVRADKFARIRLWIVGALAVDVLVTIVVVAMSGSRPLAVDVRFVESFPSNQIMLQNQGKLLSDVEVTIDSRFTARIAELPPGSTNAVGLEMDREFRDGSGQAPPRDYKPTRVQVRSGSDQMDIDLIAKK